MTKSNINELIKLQKNHHLKAAKAGFESIKMSIPDEGYAIIKVSGRTLILSESVNTFIAHFSNIGGR